jgi:hypothetical protein
LPDLKNGRRFDSPWPLHMMITTYWGSGNLLRAKEE